MLTGTATRVLNAAGNGGITGAPATVVQARKYGGKELDRENGLDWYDSQARMYDPLIGRTPTMDPMSEKYYHLSPYLWCAGNPIRYTDPTGMYSLDSISSSEKDKNYKLLVVFSSDFHEFGLDDDYNVALSSGVPIMVVDNLEDLVAGLKNLTTDMNCQFENVSLNDHGVPGILYIGDDKYNYTSNFSSLKPFFEDKNIFIEACKNGVGTDGSKLTEKLAIDTQSTVISSMHIIKTEYSYDGSLGLNGSPLQDPHNFNLYKISHYGSKSAIIKDFSIDKNKGFSWKYF